MCQMCSEEKENLESFNICEDCIFEMCFKDRDNLKKIVLNQFDELQAMITDHKEMGDINQDSICLIMSCHRHLQNIKKVVEAL